MKTKMRRLLLLAAIILLSSCTEDFIEQPQVSTSKILNGEYHIGDENRSPDLYIPQAEQGWYGWTEGMGLWNPPYKAAQIGYLGINHDIYPVALENNEHQLSYNCFIANGAPFDYSGKNDFVSDRSEDAIQEYVGSSYTFPGMLSITTFQNGLPVGEVVKQHFWVGASDSKIGYDWRQHHYYDGDTMAIQAGTADLYMNRAKVKNGKNLIVVEINPDLVITESNYNNNVSVLPVNVDLTPVASTNWTGTAVLDKSAIEENKTHPASNIVITKNFKGANKTITLDWDCPYHAPIWVKHWFTIKKNGAIIADKLEHSEYTDYVSGSFKSANYEIIIHVVGLGDSQPTIIKVTR